MPGIWGGCSVRRVAGGQHRAEADLEDEERWAVGVYVLVGGEQAAGGIVGQRRTVLTFSGE